MDVQNIIKFTRCPRCQAFSLMVFQNENHDRLPGDAFHGEIVCNNCKTQYVLQGENLKERSKSIKMKPEPAAFVEQKVAKKFIKKRGMNRSVVILSIFLVAIICGIIFIFTSTRNENGKIQVDTMPVDGEIASLKLEKPETDPISTKSIETEQLGVDNLSEKDKEFLPEESEEMLVKKNPEKKEEFIPENQKEPLEIQEPDKKVKLSQEPLYAIKKRMKPAEEQKKSENFESHALKIFEFSGLKVRSSSPHIANPSKRWYFQRKTVTIKREENQRVYIAGDPSGKEKWAVDDEIFINGERIKGCCEKQPQLGFIPEALKIPPYEITHLVPSGIESSLDIRLTDYGVVWGNTSLYIVVM